MTNEVYSFSPEHLDILVRTDATLSLGEHLKAKGLHVSIDPAAIRDGDKKPTHDLIRIGGEGTVDAVEAALADWVLPVPRRRRNYPSTRIIIH